MVQLVSIGRLMGSRPQSEIIGGIRVGSPGPAADGLNTFVLAGGDDFNTLPSIWSASQNPTGNYHGSRPARGFRCDQPPSSGKDKEMWVDPYFRGGYSQSSTNLGYQELSAANSVLTVNYELPTTAQKTYLPVSYSNGFGDSAFQPQMLTSSLFSWPSLMFSAKGDFAIDCVLQFPSGTARNFVFSLWTTGFDWPDCQELDHFESWKVGSTSTVDFQTSIHGSLTNGGADTVQTIAAAYPAVTGRNVRVLVTKAGTTLTFKDDIASAGTMATRATYTDARVARFQYAHMINLTAVVSTTWDATAFNSADWPKQVNVEYFRLWIPPGTPAAKPMMVLSPVDVTPGGAWNMTLPAASSLFSTSIAGVEQAHGVFSNEDTPAAQIAGTARLPIGMSVDLSTRAVTGTVPAGHGGSLGLLLQYSFDAGGVAQTALQPFRVAPADLMDDFNVDLSTAVQLQIAQSDFHSGDLGPHTYQVSKVSGGSWATISGNGTGTVVISGTTPASPETFTIEVSCTNSIGQTTTVQKDINVAARTNLIAHTDMSDTTTYWANTHVLITGGQTARDGTSTAILFGADTTSNLHVLGTQAANFVSFVSGHTYCASILATKNDAVQFQFALSTAAFAAGYVNFNLRTGQISNSGSIVSAGIRDIGNGWYLCWVVMTATATASASAVAFFGILSAANTRGPTFTGGGNTVKLWYPRIEEASLPTRIY